MRMPTERSAVFTSRETPIGGGPRRVRRAPADLTSARGVPLEENADADALGVRDAVHACFLPPEGCDRHLQQLPRLLERQLGAKPHATQLAAGHEP